MRSAVYPGRFDPITNGHLNVIKKALVDFNKIYVVIMENPEKITLLSVEKRLQLLHSIQNDKIIIDYWPGPAAKYCHLKNTNFLIRGYRNQTDLIYEQEKKLRYLKQDSAIKIKLYKTDTQTSSTIVKKLLKEAKSIKNLVPWEEALWNEED